MKNIKGKLLVVLVLISFIFVIYFIKNNDTEVHYNRADNTISSDNNNDETTATWEVVKTKKVQEIIIPTECLDKKNDLKYNLIVSNYRAITRAFATSELIKEYEGEYLVIKAFSKKDCSMISKENDPYTFEFCDIYEKWDYSRLDNFKFEDWETKEEAMTFYDLLKEGKLKEDNKDKLVQYIYNFEKNTTEVNFNLKEKITWFRWDIYTYLYENWKDKFTSELEKQLIEECNNL